MEHIINLFFRSIFVDNMIFAFFLGMCSYLAVSKSVKTSLGLGAAVTFVLLVTTPVNYLLLTKVLGPDCLADGDTAGLLGVILEVCLNIFIGVVTNNLNGVLVSTNGTVAADTPELALNGALSCSIRCLRILCKRQVSNVIDNTNGELTLRSILLELNIT